MIEFCEFLFGDIFVPSIQNSYEAIKTIERARY